MNPEPGQRLTGPFRPLWLASYPRSGNTFLRILLENVFQLPTYSAYNVEGQTFPDPSADTLENAPALPANWRELISHQDTGPLALIKTHDPPTDTAPAIYVVRDGRATIDSYFHYHQKFAFEKPSLTEIIAGACQFGSWSAHYSAWHPRTRAQTLFLRYEDLVAHPAEIIAPLSAFLNLPPVEGRIPTFEELRQRQPSFFRRGQNQDFLSKWTPGQMSLFSILQGPAMADLDYPLMVAPAVPADTVAELAGAASRLHALYLEQLGHEGARLALEQQFAALTKQLQATDRRLDEKTRELDFLLSRRWVRWGLALRTLKLGAASQPNPSSAGPLRTAA
jgi:hypothetical protein